jgi:hypothetical protein
VIKETKPKETRARRVELPVERLAAGKKGPR